MIHFTSDLHFGHKNVIHFCNRPYSSVEEMDDALIKNWNNNVGINDTVYSLGDMFFANISRIEEILSQLNGNIVYVHGNHCNTVINQSSRILQKKLMHSISSYKEIKIEGIPIILFHYGMRVWNKQHYGSWHLYGHSHGNLEPMGKSVDVGVDADFILGHKVYRPYTYDEVKNYMLKQKLIIGDMHNE